MLLFVEKVPVHSASEWGVAFNLPRCHHLLPTGRHIPWMIYEAQHMLPLYNYHLVGHRLVNDERGFGRLELFLQRAESDDVFGL